MSVKRRREMTRAVFDGIADRLAKNDNTIKGSSIERLRMLAVSESPREAESLLTLIQSVTVEERLLWVAYGWAQWASSGCPVFVLSPGLTASLLLTDAPPDRGFRFPFAGFELILPNDTPIVFDGRRAVVIRVTTIPISRVDGEGFATIAETDAAVCFMPRFTVTLDNDTTLSWNSRMMQESADGSMHGITRHPEINSGATEWEDGDGQREVHILMVNFLQWLESHRADGESSRMPACIESTRPFRSVEPTYIVGADIRLPAPASILRQMGTSGWRLQRRFIVRGHWRNQAVGEGRQLRRRKWIMPFWKGPRDAQEVLERTYRADSVEGT